MTSLWHVDQQIAHVFAKTDETGEIRDEDLLLLDALGLDRHEVIAGLVATIRNDEAEATAIETEIARLKAMAAPRWNRVERLKQHIFQSMKAHGEQKIDLGPLGKPRIQTNGGRPAIKIDPSVDVAKLPVEFQRITIELDKERVLAAHKAGEPIPDGITLERGEHLRI